MSNKRLGQDTGTIPVELFAAGTLQAPDGRPVVAISEYAAPPSDGRPVRVVTSTAPTDSTPRMAASLYANGLLMTADGRPVHAVQGANALAAYAQSLNFTTANYWRDGTNYAALSSMPGHAFTRTGTQLALDSDTTIDSFAPNVPAINGNGFHVFGALTNLLLNAGQNTALSTQDVAVTAVAHTIAFIGTGTVTLSGAAFLTGATLAGTSATNQVRLNFTPTVADALIVTVTGDVRYAGLYAATLGVPVPIVATAGAAVGIGASSLEEGAALPNGDFIVWAVIKLSGLPSVSVTPFSYSTAGAGSTNDRIYPIVHPTGYLAMNFLAAGGVAQPAPPLIAAVIAAGGGRAVVMLRRKNGIYSFAAKKTDGTVAIGADASGTGLVPAVTTVDIGAAHNGVGQMNGLMEGLHQRNGTFGDAEITAILAAA